MISPPRPALFFRCGRRSDFHLSTYPQQPSVTGTSPYTHLASASLPTLPLKVVKMASQACIARCMRMSNLGTSLRALSLRTSAARSATQPRQLQTRALSSTILSPAAPRIRSSLAAVPTGRASAAPAAVSAVRQQVRGMKVLSSIKKRCEHCKVR